MDYDAAIEAAEGREMYHDMVEEEMDELRATIAAQQARIAALERGLRAYADPANWQPVTIAFQGGAQCSVWLVSAYGPDVARAALDAAPQEPEEGQP